jgi:hypothetical protein
MKRKKIEINESLLMSTEEQSQIRGGERTRHRERMEDGTKIKFKNIT